MHTLTENTVFKQLLAPQIVAGTGAYVNAGTRESITCAENAVVLIDVGNCDASTQLDFKIVQADAASGGNTKDLTGAALAQIDDATGENKLYGIEVKADQFDWKNGYTFFTVAYRVTNAKNAPMSITGIKHNLREAPAANNGLTQSVYVLA